jgi:hypothetical protein
MARRHLLVPIVAALLSGCSEPTGPVKPLSSRPGAIVVIDGKLLRVFNVQLRSVEDPNIIDDPNIRPHGTLQLKLYESADGTFSLAWKGEIFNPAGEGFTGFSMTHVGIDRLPLLVSLGEVDGITDRLTEPDGGDFISADLAAALVSVEPDDSGNVGQEPEGGDFVIVFYTVERPAGALTGRL